jgi:hypothetical protein
MKALFHCDYITTTILATGGVLFSSNAQETTCLRETLMGNPPSPSRVFRLSFVIVLFAITVYSAPYLATTIVLKSRGVPYSFAPDLSLYLNLSRVGSSPVNPYFGTIAPSGEFGYTTFDTAFRMLGFLAKVAGNDLWWAVLLWNLFWWAALGVGAIWFVRRALQEATELLLCLAMSLILFFNFGVVRALASLFRKFHWHCYCSISPFKRAHWIPGAGVSGRVCSFCRRSRLRCFLTQC